MNHQPSRADSDATLKVRTLRPDERQAWDDFVRRSPQGSVFNLTDYLDAFSINRDTLVIEGPRGIEAGLILARGILGLPTNPLFVKHLGLLYREFSGKPITQTTHQRKLASLLIDKLSSLQAFDYNFDPSFVDWLPFFWRGFRQETRYTYRISPDHATTWLSAADTRVRNDCRRAEKAGLEVIEDPPFGMASIAYSLTYERQGARPPISPERLARILERLREGECAKLFGVRTQSGTIGAFAAVVYDGRTAFLTITGYSHDAGVGATTLAVVAAINWVLSRGMIFDFEGSMIPSIEAFYRGFGGQLTPYFRIWRPGPVQTAKTIGFGIARRILGYAR